MDTSRPMLARARAHVATRGWHTVTLLEADAARLDAALSAGSARELFDAALFTYSLSIIGEWRDAYVQTLAGVRPDARIAVVDMAPPVGRWRVFCALARLARFTGGADITRAPWTLVLRTTTAPTHQVVRGGHIHIGAGTRP